MVILQETHLRNNEIINISGYISDPQFFNNRKESNIRARKGYGGVAILFRSEVYKFYNVKLIDRSFDGIIAVELCNKVTHFSIIVIGCYLPPEQSVWGRDAVSFYTHLLNFVYEYSDVDALYICGDLNSRIGNKSDYIVEIDDIGDRDVIDFTVNNHGTALQEFLIDSRFCIINGRVSPADNNFTFVHPRGRSVVDFVLASIDNIITCKKFDVILPKTAVDSFCDEVPDTGTISDHSILKFVIATCDSTHANDSYENANRPMDGVNNVNCGLSVEDMYFKRFRIDKVPREFMQSENRKNDILKLSNAIENIDADQQVVDSIYKDICNIFYDEMNSFFQSTNTHPSVKKKSFRKYKPFWNNNLQQLWSNTKKAEQAFVKSDVLDAQFLRLRFKEAQNKFDKEYRKEKRRFNYLQIEKLDNSVKNNPREFWKMIKSLGPQKTVNIPFEVYDEESNLIDDQNVVLNKWKLDFENLYAHPIDINYCDRDFYNGCVSQLEELEADVGTLPGLNHNITIEEVKKVINLSKNNKSVGIDNIPNEVLKNTSSVNLLFVLFKKLFEIGFIPLLWYRAILKPIPKGSTVDTRNPLEYRGISLLSTVYKLFSSILNKRIVKFCENNMLFAEEQNGFRQKRSCDDHSFVLTSIIRNRKHSNEPTFVGFIDLRKAFDCVDRNLLFYKLLKNGISGRMYNCLKNIYANCESAVNVNGFITQFFNIDYGVRQGDCLSSTLFLLFINDLVKILKENTYGIRNEYFELQCLMFADDIAFVAATEIDLQTMFNCLFEWCSKWRMRVNVDKTCIMHFRNPRQKLTSFTFKYGDENIKIVNKYKYLGLIYHENLNFNATAEALADSGGRALGAMYCKYKRNSGFGYNVYTKLFNTGVVPILDYGSCIWGKGSHDKINTVQNRAIRMFLAVHKFAPNLAINGDMGWVSSQTRRFINIMKYWNRLIKMHHSRLTKRVFLWDKSCNAPNWCFDVKEILESISLTNIYVNVSYANITQIRNKLIHLYENGWREQVYLSPKLRTYSVFKTQFCTENYLNCISNRGHRSIMAQFRCGILPLSVETGRFLYIPLEFRLCKFCNHDVLEDEMHFLLNCPFYADLRNNLILKAIEKEQNYYFLETVDKLKLFMSRELVKYTAKFLYESFQRRRAALYVS